MGDQDKVKKEKPKEERKVTTDATSVKHTDPKPSTAAAAAAATTAATGTSKIMTAESANKGFKVPPYEPGTVVEETQTGTGDSFVRAYTEGTTNPTGSPWMMQASEVEGLTPTQIQTKFGMPNTPTHLVEVKPPAGTTVRVGTASAGYVPGGGGGIQYQLMERIPETSFVNPTEIPSLGPGSTPIVDPAITPDLMIDPIVDPIIDPEIIDPLIL
jgi:hypothetical protein